jgi:hypothetical protein
VINRRFGMVCGTVTFSWGLVYVVVELSGRSGRVGLLVLAVVSGVSPGGRAAAWAGGAGMGFDPESWTRVKRFV